MSKLSYLLVRSSNVIGVAVTNAQNEDLGKVEELVIDKFNGKIKYAVLSFGGILGMGDKLFALPWRSLSFNPDKHKFEIGLSLATLKEAPGFDKEDWPDLASHTWQTTVEDFFTG